MLLGLLALGDVVVTHRVKLSRAQFLRPIQSLVTHLDSFDLIVALRRGGIQARLHGCLGDLSGLERLVSAIFWIGRACDGVGQSGRAELRLRHHCVTRDLLALHF